MPKSQRVFPVDGYYLTDVPHVEHDCTDPACVESGAFTTKRPPRSAEADAQTTGPADAGPSDSEA